MLLFEDVRPHGSLGVPEDFPCIAMIFGKQAYCQLLLKINRLFPRKNRREQALSEEG